MMFTLTYISSQILAVIYYILFSLTYYMKKRTSTLFIGFIAILIHSISYLLLGGYTATMMGVVAVFRNIIFMYEDKINKKSKLLLYILYFITIIFGIVTYKDFFSILPIIATILYTYSVWQTDVKNYKLFGFISSFIYVIYNIYLKSIFGILLEFIKTLYAFIGYIKDKGK